MPGPLILNGPVGSGQTNDPDDVYAFDNALRKIGAYAPPPEYAAEPQRYPTEPMIHALERFQDNEELKVDRYANPGGPTERAINNKLLDKPRGAGLLHEPADVLSNSVGNGFANEPEDVRNVQRGLGGLGYLPEDPFDRPHGIIDEATTKGVKGFQKDNGLTADGWLAPNGETEKALRKELGELATRSADAWHEFWKRESEATNGRRSSGDDDEGDAIIPARGGLGLGPSIPPPPSGSSASRPAPGGRLGLWPEPLPKDLRNLMPPHLRRETSGSRQRFFTKPGERVPPDSGNQPPNYDPVPRDAEPPRVEDLARWMQEIDRGDPVAKYRYFPRPGQPRQPGEPAPGTIIITPPPGDELAIPLIRSERQDYGRTGSPSTRQATRDLMWTIVDACKDLMPGAQVEHLGGPAKRGPDEGEILTSKLKRDAKKNGIIVVTNAGGSFGDGTVLFRYGGVDVIFQFDTFTARKSDRQPIPREQRQYTQLEYNESDRNSVLARMPKPFKGEEIDREALGEFAFRLCRKVKEAVDRGEMSNDENTRKKQIKQIFEKMIEAAEKQKANAKRSRVR